MFKDFFVQAVCVNVAPAYFTLQGPDAHVLFVKLILLKSDALHQIINSSVLGLQHELTEKYDTGATILIIISFLFDDVFVRKINPSLKGGPPVNTANRVPVSFKLLLETCYFILQ